MTRLVVASNNPGKLRELEAMLAPLGFDPAAQSTLGVSEAEEPHETFLENALAKARHACVATGLPSLADDSGIEIDHLDGRPGVHSARWVEEGEWIPTVLRELDGVPVEGRGCRVARSRSRHAIRPPPPAARCPPDRA